MQLTLFDDIYEDQNTGDPLLETLLLRGSGFENGKKRIYEYVMTNPTKAKLVTFLKDEYGIKQPKQLLKWLKKGFI